MSNQPSNPDCNTGFPLQTGIDYLTFTTKIPIAQVRDIIAQAAAICDAEPGIIWQPERPVTRGRYYDHSAKFLAGGDAAWSAPDDNGNSSIRVSLPGQIISRVPLLAVVELIEHLERNYKIKWTRADIKLDDFERKLDVVRLREAIANKNHLKFREATYFENQTKGGFTQYLGSPQSNKRMRIYDKNIESKGKINSIRMELQLREESAQEFIANLIQFAQLSEQDITNFFREIILNAVDFRDRNFDSNISRCPQLPFWNEFLEYCNFSGGFQISTPRKVSTLEKKLKWMSRQVASTVSIFMDCFGINGFQEYINGIIQKGRERYRDEHYAILQMYYSGLDAAAVP